jgi:hypothetical protein
VEEGQAGVAASSDAGMPRDAFISHCTKDGAELAETLCLALETRTLRCWIAPRDVAWDSGYGPAIDAAIRDCGVFVILMTPEAAKSEELGREAQLASQYRKRMIPISVDGVEPGQNLRYYIAGWQYFRCPRVPDEKDMDRLAHAVRGTSASVAPDSSARVRSRRSVRPWQLIAIAGSVIGLLALVMYLVLGDAWLRRPATPVTERDESKDAARDKQRESLSLPVRPAPSESISASPVPSSRTRDGLAAVKSSPVSVVNNRDALIVNQTRLPFVRVQGGSVAPFEMSVTEVTQEVWKQVMEDNPSDFDGDELPVHNVTWKEALSFVGKLNQRNDGYKYRLPTEAEWEYAAKANNPAPPNLMTTA